VEKRQSFPKMEQIIKSNVEKSSGSPSPEKNLKINGEEED
jgi:hypothetical protein